MYWAKDSVNMPLYHNSSLQQLQIKKNKLTLALAASKRKHKVVLAELLDKLQFLRDEEDLALKEVESKTC